MTQLVNCFYKINRQTNTYTHNSAENVQKRTSDYELSYGQNAVQTVNQTMKQSSKHLTCAHDRHVARLHPLEETDKFSGRAIVKNFG